MAYRFDEIQTTLCAATFASCFYDYVGELLNKSLKTVIIYSDGCCYQNRNSVLLNALLYLSMSKKVTIVQKYLEKDIPKWSVIVCIALLSVSTKMSTCIFLVSL